MPLYIRNYEKNYEVVFTRPDDRRPMTVIIRNEEFINDIFSFYAHQCKDKIVFSINDMDHDTSYNKIAKIIINLNTSNSLELNASYIFYNFTMLIDSMKPNTFLNSATSWRFIPSNHKESVSFTIFVLDPSGNYIENRISDIENPEVFGDKIEYDDFLKYSAPNFKCVYDLSYADIKIYPSISMNFKYLKKFKTSHMDFESNFVYLYILCRSPKTADLQRSFINQLLKALAAYAFINKKFDK